MSLKLLALNVQTIIFGKGCRLKVKLFAVWIKKDQGKIELFNLSLRKMWCSGNWNGFELNLSKNKLRQMKMIKQNIYFNKALEAWNISLFEAKSVVLDWDSRTFSLISLFARNQEAFELLTSIYCQFKRKYWSTNWNLWKRRDIDWGILGVGVDEG